MAEYLCVCDGGLERKLRFNRQTQRYEKWLVCPFCHVQRLRADVLAEQKADDGEDRVLTQPAAHP